MQVKKDEDNGIKQYIQEVLITRLPRCSATKEKIVWSAKKYHSNHGYNIYNHISTDTVIICTNISIQTPL